MVDEKVFILLLILLIGVTPCGEKGIFKPTCTPPSREEFSSPTAITVSEGYLIILNGDFSQKFCGGFIQRLSKDGSFLPPIVLQEKERYEGFSIDLVALNDEIITVGRKNFIFLKYNIRTGEKTGSYPATNIQRIFPGTDSYFFAYREKREGKELLRIHPNPFQEETILPVPETVTSFFYDRFEKKIYLGFQGNEGIWVVSEKGDVERFFYPFGYRSYHSIRFLLPVEKVLYFLDGFYGVVASIDLERGEPSPPLWRGKNPFALVRHYPFLFLLTGDGEIWKMDLSGTPPLPYFSFIAESFTQTKLGGVVEWDSKLWITDFQGDRLFSYPLSYPGNGE
jgi:hypothetical protein